MSPLHLELLRTLQEDQRRRLSRRVDPAVRPIRRQRRKPRD